MKADRGLHFVACIEATKGVLALAAASGLLSLLHSDVRRVAELLVEHAHLNPASHYPHIFLDAAANLGDAGLLWMAAGTAAYAAVRFTEAYGLFRERAWAEWLAALGGLVYMPFEAAELWREPGWATAAILGLNALIVGIVVRAFLRARGRRGFAPVPEGS